MGQINFVGIIKDNIRNMRPINEEQRQFIMKLEKKDLCEIINTLINVNETLVEMVKS